MKNISPLLSVLIETNGCVDTGEKLGVKQITAFKSQGTSVMIDYNSTAHYCHSYLFPIPVSTDNGDPFYNTSQCQRKEQAANGWNMNS